MYQKLWKDLHGAVCSINFYSDNGIKLTSLTGFKVNNNIVTDEFIYKIQKCDEVVFQFVKQDGYTPNQIIKMPFAEFTERVNRLVEFENEGYALIAFDETVSFGAPSLSLALNADYTIGEQIAVIGYHIDQDNLSIKNGIISSLFKTPNGKRFIQFDAAIKQGNSGSPLVSMTTGKVIGVVGYRLAAATKSYEAFKTIIDENLRLLKKSEGKMNIMDIDPIQVLIANQNQLKQISKEFYKSATMSFGYAHEILSVHNYIESVLGTSANITEKKKVKA
jgi:V8-like Glu-specific endopeptidase